MDGKMEAIRENPIIEFHPDTIEFIRKMYGLDNGRMVQSVDILEEWMKKQAHFTNKNYSNTQYSREYLERLIITCKGSVEKAKSQIDKLCTLKTLVPKYFIDHNLKEKLAEITDIAYLIPLPKMTKEYQRIFVVKINERELTTNHFLDYYRLSLVICEYLKAHDYVDGYVVVYDLRNTNLTDLVTKLNLVDFQQFLSILIEGFGAKIKAIHVISQSKVVDLLLKTVKTMLPPKIGKRVYVHTDFDAVNQFLDRDILPIEFGGSEKSVKILYEELKKIIFSEEHEKYLKVTKASCTDESLRQADKFNEQYVGMPGSFRTLTVD